MFFFRICAIFVSALGAILMGTYQMLMAIQAINGRNNPRTI